MCSDFISIEKFPFIFVQDSKSILCYFPVTLSSWSKFPEFDALLVQFHYSLLTSAPSMLIFPTSVFGFMLYFDLHFSKVRLECFPCTFGFYSRNHLSRPSGPGFLHLRHGLCFLWSILLPGLISLGIWLLTCHWFSYFHSIFPIQPTTTF